MSDESVVVSDKGINLTVVVVGVLVVSAILFFLWRDVQDLKKVSGGPSIFNMQQELNRMKAQMKEMQLQLDKKGAPLPPANRDNAPPAEQVLNDPLFGPPPRR